MIKWLWFKIVILAGLITVVSCVQQSDNASIIQNISSVPETGSLNVSTAHVLLREELDEELFVTTMLNAFNSQNPVPDLSYLNWLVNCARGSGQLIPNDDEPTGPCTLIGVSLPYLRFNVPNIPEFMQLRIQHGKLTLHIPAMPFLMAGLTDVDEVFITEQHTDSLIIAHPFITPTLLPHQPTEDRLLLIDQQPADFITELYASWQAKDSPLVLLEQNGYFILHDGVLLFRWNNDDYQVGLSTQLLIEAGVNIEVFATSLSKSNMLAQFTQGRDYLLIMPQAK